MSDPVTLARTARESLAQGLQALQGDASVPRSLLELAAPIARAMGELHQIERGAEPGGHALAALASVQNALTQLQARPPEHPAVVSAIEAVASALGSIHALTRLVRGEPAETRPDKLQPASRHPSAHPIALQPQPARAIAQQPQPQPAAPVHAPLAPAGDAPIVVAELGAHSPSNFYKGLAGNDIIDHGGLFVSTYKLPKLGQPVRLKVSMPGGYEFEANAVVRWRREPHDDGNDAPPGFGAQLVGITAEARQLVYRYVRNREPLFHDDF